MHRTNTGQEAQPYVLGGLNKETQFVLDKFAVETPPLLGALENDAKVFFLFHDFVVVVVVVALVGRSGTSAVSRCIPMLSCWHLTM